MFSACHLLRSDRHHPDSPSPLLWRKSDSAHGSEAGIARSQKSLSSQWEHQTAGDQGAHLRTSGTLPWLKARAFGRHAAPSLAGVGTSGEPEAAFAGGAWRITGRCATTRYNILSYTRGTVGRHKNAACAEMHRRLSDFSLFFRQQVFQALAHLF